MRTLLTGQQVTSVLCPVNRAFFFLAGDYFLFFRFFSKKKCVPLCLFLSRCTHSLDILLFNVFQQRKLVIMTKKRCFMEVLLDHVCVLALKRRSRYE
jgi:hypothetical protein